MRRTVGLGGYAAVAFVSYVSFGVLTCSCSSFSISLTLSISPFYSLFLAHSYSFACLLFHFFLFFSFLAVFISFFLSHSFFFDAFRYPFSFTSISFFSARSFFHYYIFPYWFKNTHVTSNNRFLVCYTHYRDDENSAFGSFKLDGLSDFTYTRLYLWSASGPVCILLSLVLSSAQQGYLYKLRKIGILRAIRARTSHTNSALQGNARTDRFCRSFHSSRPRATATLLIHAHIRAFVYASKSSDIRACANRRP